MKNCQGIQLRQFRRKSASHPVALPTGSSFFKMILSSRGAAGGQEADQLISVFIVSP